MTDVKNIGVASLTERRKRIMQETMEIERWVPGLKNGATGGRRNVMRTAGHGPLLTIHVVESAPETDRTIAMRSLADVFHQNLDRESIDALVYWLRAVPAIGPESEG